VTRRNSSERGAALAVTLILTTALLGAGALALYLQLSDTKAAGSLTESRSALYCAEAGLASGRAYVAARVGEWGVMLDDDPDNDPDGYPVVGDLDGDGANDYTVSIRDNDDEIAPADDVPTVDLDGTIFMVSTCIKHPDAPREVLEMLSFGGGGTNYRNQSGQGVGGSSNAN